MRFVTRLPAAALALAATLAAAPAAGAQATAGENALRPGASSINVGVSPDPSVGYWRMLSGRTALGVVGSVQAIRDSAGDDELSRTFVTVSPQVKHYHSTEGAILPYLHGALLASVADLGSSTPESDDRRTVLGGTAALGLDWFPVRRVSVGGHAGLGLLRASSSIGGADGDDFESVNWSLQTFTAAIQVQLYL